MFNPAEVHADFFSISSRFVCVYFRAILYNRMKLMFVGVQGIGKTSLLDQLRKEGRSSSPKNKVSILFMCNKWQS